MYDFEIMFKILQLDLWSEIWTKSKKYQHNFGYFLAYVGIGKFGSNWPIGFLDTKNCRNVCSILNHINLFEKCDQYKKSTSAKQFYFSI